MVEDKELIKIKEKKIVYMVNAFSYMNLDQECGELCIKIVKKLGRKREVPFKRGKLEIWASGAIHAISTINFLFDNESSPHIGFDDIVNFFNTNKSTVGSKSKQIRDLLKINHFNKEFTKRDVMVEYYEYCFIESDEGILLPLSHFDDSIRMKIIDELIDGNSRGYKVTKPIFPPFYRSLPPEILNAHSLGLKALKTINEKNEKIMNERVMDEKIINDL